MNGRIYDARLGRFLQADPNVDGVTNTQGYNRYSYVQNNPLNATDPTGYFSLRKIVGIVVAAIGTYICGPECGQLGYTLIGASAGAASAAVNGGNILQGAIMGGISAAAFSAVGTAFDGCASCAGDVFGSGLNGWAFAGKIAAHGVVGGVMAELQGGKFGHGFAAAGVTQAFAGKIGGVDNGSRFSVARIALAAIVGGTASKLTGGKFANGAMTGAFSRMFNDEAHYQNGQTARRNFYKKYGDIIKAGEIDIDKNVSDARQFSGEGKEGFEKWYNKVKTGGEWDYKSPQRYGYLAKQFGSTRMDQFGNVHFGIVAAAYGFPLSTSMFGAGTYQVFRQDGGSLMSWSVAPPLAPNFLARAYTNLGFGWGDNPGDSANIMEGHDYHNDVYGCSHFSCY